MYPEVAMMPGTNRLLCLGASVLLVGLAAQPAPAVAHDLPRTYVVSRSPGVLPEGIAIDRDGTMYVSSDGTGVPRPARPCATAMHSDRRSPQKGSEPHEVAPFT
ncbi:hypothetical protein ABZS62_37050, partial [Streptomyces sp900116325]